MIEPEAELKHLKPNVWGPWATIGFGLVVIIVSIVVQVIIAVIFFMVTMIPRPEDFTGFNYTELLQKIDLGLLVSLSIIISAIVCVGLIAILVKIRSGVSFAGYLGFTPIRARMVFIALSISVGYIGLAFLVNWALNIPQETDVMTEAYATSVWPAMFWIAVIVFAPLFEEVFFRGFLYEGLRYSKLGDAGTIVVTSFVWAGFHLQYGLFQIASIFVLGVIFGVMRYRIGSLWAPILMHAFHNFVAVLFIALEVGI